MQAAGPCSDVAHGVTDYQEDQEDQSNEAEEHCEALVCFSYHLITSPRCS
jgi:hypothetical protein